MQDWKPIRVTIHQGQPELDAVGAFDAFTLGDDWNGWATPYFSREEGIRIVAWTEALARDAGPDAVETVRWDDRLEAFIVESPEEPHEVGETPPDQDIVAPVSGPQPDVELYPIGTYRWTWQSIDSSD